MMGRSVQQSENMILTLFGLLILMQQLAIAFANNATESATATMTIVPSATPTSGSISSASITSADLNKIIIGSVFGSGGVTAIIFGLIVYCLKDWWRRQDNISVKLKTKRFHKKILDELKLDYATYSSFSETNSDGKAFADLIDQVLLSFRSKTDKRSLKDLIDEDVFYKRKGEFYAKKIASALKTIFAGGVGTDWSRRRNQLDSERLTDKEKRKCLIEACKSALITSDGILEYIPLIKIQTQILKVYQERYASLSHLFRDDKREYSIKDCFINLSIVKSADQRRREETISQATTGMKDFTEVMDEHRHFHTLVDDSTEVMRPETIFIKCNELKGVNESMQIIATGAAGIGKSTLCQKIAYQAIDSDQSWFPGMLILWVPLREWQNKKGDDGKSLSLFQFVQQRYGLEEDPESQFKEHKKDILWLLDGYDEIANERKDNLILDRDLNYVFGNCHYFLTSRPAHTESIRSNLEVSIVGLVDEDVEAFIKSYFESGRISIPRGAGAGAEAGAGTGLLAVVVSEASTKADSLIAYINDQPVLKRLSQIPILLDLICFLFDSGRISSELNTMSMLYERILFSLSEWHLKRNLSEHEFSELSNLDIQNRCKVIHVFLEALAFYGLNHRQIIIKPDFIELARKEAQATETSQFYPNIALTNFGVMRAIISKEARVTAKEHYFIHLSFQEYYAARYLANKIKSLVGEATEIPTGNPIHEFILKYKYKKGMALVLSFVAGILSQEAGPGNALKAYFKLLFGGPGEISDFEEPLLIACLKEARADERIEGSELYQKNILYKMLFYRDFYGSAYSPLPITAFSPGVKASFESVMSISVPSNREIRNKWLEIKFTLGDIEALGELIRNKGRLSSKNSKILKLINKEQERRLLTMLLEFLGDTELRIKSVAAWLLTMLRLSETQKVRVLESLLALSREGTAEVKGAAAIALVNLKLSETQIMPVIESLLALIREGTAEVKIRAENALGSLRLSETQTGEVIESLLALIREGTVEVKRMAAFALVGLKLSETQTMPVIESLLVLSREGTAEVKEAAAFVLGGLRLSATQTMRVIESLLALSREGTAEVKRTTANALGKLKLSETETEQVLERLLALSREGSAEVKGAAAIALGNLKLSETQIMPVIESLLALIREGRVDVKIRAANALGSLKLSETQTGEVIESLLALIRGGTAEVKRMAANALGSLKLSETQTMRVIESLLALIREGSAEVKGAAAIALGNLKLSETQTMPVIESLLALSREGTAEVKRTAANALGRLKLSETETEQVLESLLALSREGVAEVKRTAANALGRLKLSETQTERVLESLLALSREGAAEVKRTAANALVNLKLSETQTERVIESLLALSREGTAGVKEAAAIALGSLRLSETQTGEVIESLLALSREGAAGVKEAATIALRWFQLTETQEDIVRVALASASQPRDGGVGAGAGAVAVENHIAIDVDHAARENPDARVSVIFAGVEEGTPASAASIVASTTVVVPVADSSSAAGTGLSSSR
jgi:HEAT repeat protein